MRWRRRWEERKRRRLEPPELRRVRELVHRADRLAEAVARELPSGVRNSRA